MEEAIKVVVFTVKPCPPCDILLEAVEQIQASVTIDIRKADVSDKNAMGRMLLAGVTQFPTVELQRGDRTVWSMSGIAQTDSPEVIARQIERAILNN